MIDGGSVEIVTINAPRDAAASRTIAIARVSEASFAGNAAVSAPTAAIPPTQPPNPVTAAKTTSAIATLIGRRAMTKLPIDFVATSERKVQNDATLAKITAITVAMTTATSALCAGLHSAVMCSG